MAEIVVLNAKSPTEDMRQRFEAFYSTNCFWLGQETTKLGKAPEDQILIASVKSHCVKP